MIVIEVTNQSSFQLLDDNFLVAERNFERC